MPRRATTDRPDSSSRPPLRPQSSAWKLEDAKARFSEVVRRARAEGRQRVTVRGKDAVVVIAAEALDRLLPSAKPRQNLVAFLQGVGIGDLDVTRERDTGRDIAL
jgi:prevent-host-death family protein